MMKHVVFGIGPIGSALVSHLEAAGEQVVAINRSGSPIPGSNASVLGGDAADSEFAASAASGADVVYQCLNPPYTKWPELFPPLQDSVLDAAGAAGAKLVSFGNLYLYGPTHGSAITEDLPYAATGSKGRVRAEMDQQLLTAHEAGKTRVAIGRASDYFGPGGLVTHMGERVFYPALAGKKAQVMGDPDQLHTFSYIPDIAAGLATLGQSDAADGRAWHLPNDTTLTTRQVIEKVFDAAGTEPGISAMPRFMVGLIGMFNGPLREIKEVLFEFEEPFVVNSSDFESTFGRTATPLSEAIPTTVEWFRVNPKR